MTATEVQRETTLRLRRRFAAPRERVFRAWTDPQELKRWWGPVGYEAPSAEVDLRTGEHYRLGMRKLPDGKLFYLSGTFREVKPPEKLVYTWRWESQEMDIGETLVSVEFRDLGRSTEVVLTHELFPTAEARQNHEKGWSSCMDRLAELVVE